jgi:phosphoglycolate phosphatase
MTEDPMPTHDRPAYSEEDYTPVVCPGIRPRLLPGTSVEVIRELAPGQGFGHVLFDFDGTLSLIREGWPEVMVSMMVEELMALRTGESEAGIERVCREFVTALTGKQTIYQMIRLAEEIKARGGVPRDPLEYKAKYHDRLMERIRGRREALRNGNADARDYLVPGALEMLEALKRRSLPMYLASGTDQEFVAEEAGLLGLTRFFEGHVYGAIADYTKYSKQMVIERILAENRVDGRSLLGFGDGYVEIKNIKDAGGVGVAVASDEAGCRGLPDPWKRERLINVGADIVIPDFREHEALVAYLFRPR